jgi:hypothetical protein
MGVMVLRRAAGGLAICALLSATGCGAVTRSGTGSCSLDGTVFFEGRSYIPAEKMSGMKGRDPRPGEYLGLGETAACPGREPHEVQMFKVVGVSVERAVHTKDSYGLMIRKDSDSE